ncbi:hypothetical protein [Helicobacter sp. L8]|uniref:hypothetical protein n=1 Tax=Helicobacter sp. L8 TaxID=2316078 RepID=UPI0013CE0E87|nr:hypothetical protein [Helicobacter sp. L8]
MSLSPLKILFNASVLLGELTGIGFYTLTFAKALEAHFKGRKDVQLYWWARGKFYENLEELQQARSLSLSLSLSLFAIV